MWKALIVQSRTDFPRCQRYASLDFWRGIACLMVVVFHSWVYAAGREQLHGEMRFAFLCIRHLWIGVPLFFVISGYCISSTCDSMRRKSHSAKTYFWRRYRRIFPPFWICTLIVAAVLMATKLTHRFDFLADPLKLIPDPAALSLSQWLGTLTLTETWRGTLFHHGQLFLAPTWSLCYEEQFYFVSGMLLFFAPWRFFRNAALVSVMTGIVMIVASATHVPIGGFFFDGRWLLFAFGILVYWVLNYAFDPIASELKWTMTVASFLIVAGLLYRPTRAFLVHQRILEALAAFVFGVALLHLRKFDHRIMRSRMLAPISWCGSMCYSLYLVHYPVATTTSRALAVFGVNSPAATLTLVIPLSVLSSIVAARLFFVTVERPFLNPPSSITPSPSLKVFSRKPSSFGSELIAKEPNS